MSQLRVLPGEMPRISHANARTCLTRMLYRRLLGSPWSEHSPSNHILLFVHSSVKASARFPENTLASFEAAIRDGAEGIESGI